MKHHRLEKNDITNMTKGTSVHESGLGQCGPWIGPCSTPLLFPSCASVLPLELPLQHPGWINVVFLFVKRDLGFHVGTKIVTGKCQACDLINIPYQYA